VLLPVTADKPPDVTLDKIQTPQGSKALRLTGKHLELIDLTSFRFSHFEDKLTTAKISSDEGSIEITLPDVISANPGFYALNFTLNDKDKTAEGALVVISKPKVSK